MKISSVMALTLILFSLACNEMHQAQPNSWHSSELRPSLPFRGKYNHGYRIEETYDRFADQTEIKFGKGLPTWRITGNIVFHVFIKGAHWTEPPADVEVLMTTAYRTDRSGQILRFLLDDTARVEVIMDLGTRNDYFEIYIGTLPLRDIARIASAYKIEGSATGKVFEWTTEENQAIRDFASRLNPK